MLGSRTVMDVGGKGGGRGAGSSFEGNAGGVDADFDRRFNDFDALLLAFRADADSPSRPSKVFLRLCVGV